MGARLGASVGWPSTLGVVTVRIVLADDHAVVRSGLRLLLDAEDDLEVVAEAGDAESALRSVLGHKPDVLVLDLNMPGNLTSLQALALVPERSPGTHTVVLTMQDDPEFARRAMRAGAKAYVLKEAADTDLVEAIRQASLGQTYVLMRVWRRYCVPPCPGVSHNGMTPPEDTGVAALYTFCCSMNGSRWKKNGA